MPDEDVERWTWVVGVLMDLRDAESTPQVLALYAADLLDPTIIGDVDDYQQAIRGEDDRYLPRPIGLFDFYAALDRRPTQSVNGWKAGQDGSPHEPARAAPVPGRNAPCPCGSGRKYKHCCGRGGRT